jgi:hypothetical protein
MVSRSFISLVFTLFCVAPSISLRNSSVEVDCYHRTSGCFIFHLIRGDFFSIKEDESFFSFVEKVYNTDSTKTYLLFHYDLCEKIHLFYGKGLLLSLY